jgi:uncharacterized protein (DUF58 family)
MTSRTEELLKKVRQIEIKTKGLSRHLFSGEYHSAFKGRGMSFSEVRSYHYGDDVRSLDWNVTARTGAPHIKVFEEERELTLMLLIDVSASAAFGTQNAFKQDIITEISAVLAFSASQNNDKVGLLLFSDEVEMYIPPKKGKAHILYLIRMLIDYQPKNKGTDFNVALEFLNKVQKKRTICFVLSDFVSANAYQKNLSVSAKRHDIIGIKMNDTLESELPNVGLINVTDLETSTMLWLDTASQSVRNHYKSNFFRQEKLFEETFSKSGAEIIKIQTTSSYIHALLAFFKNRT